MIFHPPLYFWHFFNMRLAFVLAFYLTSYLAFRLTVKEAVRPREPASSPFCSDPARHRNSGSSPFCRARQSPKSLRVRYSSRDLQSKGHWEQATESARRKTRRGRERRNRGRGRTSIPKHPDILNLASWCMSSISINGYKDLDIGPNPRYISDSTKQLPRSSPNQFQTTLCYPIQKSCCTRVHPWTHHVLASCVDCMSKFRNASPNLVYNIPLL